jgi:hypothetical protein
MLDVVYKFVQSHPQEVTWGFTAIAGIWLAFAYFRQHAHEQKMKRLEHELTLDRSKRGSIYALKAASYERYVRMLDDFGAKHQTQLAARMQPIFSTYMTRMLTIQNGDDVERANVITTFSQEVFVLFDEAQADFLKMKAESRALRLTASDRLVALFDELEQQVEASTNDSRALIGDLPALLMAGGQTSIQERTQVLGRLAEAIASKSQELSRQMRCDLNEI